jgi:hypothetical protein
MWKEKVKEKKKKMWGQPPSAVRRAQRGRLA